ncbi:hypothetical protein [Scytonema sp. UIC 10036]|uniref:ribbon-helix-helix domain-containing protein n=1 Tax=Scytonema sp. UIC 10036 TaxID=2304196 RepID=UPI001A9B6F35|nr:hypothetical protein [Scytonema sp. UIC 10036]
MTTVVYSIVMPTQKPRVTLRFEEDEYEKLKQWAESEIRTVPQLVYAVVIKALQEKFKEEK